MARFSILALTLLLGGCAIVPQSWVEFFSSDQPESAKYDSTGPDGSFQQAPFGDQGGNTETGGWSAFAPVQAERVTPFAIAVMQHAEGEAGSWGAEDFVVLTEFHSASGRVCKVAAISGGGVETSKRLVCARDGKAYVAREIF